MKNKYTDISTQCQYDLKNNGFCQVRISLPECVKNDIINEDYPSLDANIFKLTNKDGVIFDTLTHFVNFSYIEHIISVRDSKNDWEEDGIWHDDGSRVLAFSLSLTTKKIEGGVLEIRKKNNKNSHKIPTPSYSEMIIFKTGLEGFEHKINKVINGKRTIIAGWCYP